MSDVIGRAPPGSAVEALCRAGAPIQPERLLQCWHLGRADLLAAILRAGGLDDWRLAGWSTWLGTCPSMRGAPIALLRELEAALHVQRSLGAARGAHRSRVPAPGRVDQRAEQRRAIDQRCASLIARIEHSRPGADAESGRPRGRAVSAPG